MKKNERVEEVITSLIKKAKRCKTASAIRSHIRVCIDYKKSLSEGYPTEGIDRALSILRNRLSNLKG